MSRCARSQSARLLRRPNEQLPTRIAPSPILPPCTGPFRSKKIEFEHYDFLGALAASASLGDWPGSSGVGTSLGGFGFSSGALPADRMEMNRLSVSNQNGAPSVAASAVMSQPRRWNVTVSPSVDASCGTTCRFAISDFVGRADTACGIASERRDEYPSRVRAGHPRPLRDGNGRSGREGEGRGESGAEECRAMRSLHGRTSGVNHDDTI